MNSYRKWVQSETVDVDTDNTFQNVESRVTFIAKNIVLKLYRDRKRFTTRLLRSHSAIQYSNKRTITV